ncbi:hypothetical protein CDL12_27261 [Handroanthus impetiginosus]|uniref:Uncharacterized protein n=1 Tax=Handroanthus impetiginosus TaxID=429701 RepID=A0A2G9G521_9LAMI|nr:hypothetical protein CDL12_27261 [Handroanthus impetiginosus]
MQELGSSQKRGALAKTRATNKKEDRAIELPSMTTILTAEVEKHSRFYFYHRKISCSAMDYNVLTSVTSSLL